MNDRYGYMQEEDIVELNAYRPYRPYRPYRTPNSFDYQDHSFTGGVPPPPPPLRPGHFPPLDDYGAPGSPAWLQPMNRMSDAPSFANSPYNSRPTSPSLVNAISFSLVFGDHTKLTSLY